MNCLHMKLSTFISAHNVFGSSECESLWFIHFQMLYKILWNIIISIDDNTNTIKNT